jgi:DNA-binding FrmR family transcriptional regulator
MIEDEAAVKDIVQQISAIRSAMGQAANEEIVSAIERMTEKKSSLDASDHDEIRTLMKLVR